jgi:2,3-bisphosphoglycerate-dependent phosphoglycerate mutase
VTQDATRLTAIRHGETDWNRATRIQGQLDIGLNDTGRWQAERLAQALADEAFDALYASDLARAYDTACALARGVRPAPQRLVGLRERGFGAFEGLTYAEIEHRFPDQARRWRQRDAAFGAAGGETLQAFNDRVLAVVVALAERHRSQHIAIVAHGGVLDVLYRAATRLALDAPRTWQLGNASINRLLHGAQGFSLVGWGDCLHLEDPSLEEGTA